MPTVNKGLYKWLIGRGTTLEDFADRLNHFWTFGLLLLFASIISWKQGYNKAINCWVPAEFTDSMVNYAEATCWNSYFIHYLRDQEKADEEILEMFNITFPRYFTGRHHLRPWVESDPIKMSDSLRTKMSTTRTLYQWLPVILCFQALLFKLPNLLMYILHGYSGVSFEKISGLTSGYKNMNLQERDLLCRQIARYLFNWCCQFINWLPWRLLSLLWLIVKILYCVNIIAQMSLIDSFLKTTDPPIDNSTSYGDVIMGNLFENNATLWKQSPAFPREVMCNFEIIQLRNVHQYTVQCNLTANFFNEYVYMFLWVWLLFVAIVTCLSLVFWLLKALIPVFRKRYIKKAIAVADDTDVPAIPQYNLDRFCDVIGEDGVMTLKLIGANSSELLVSNVINSMWKLKIDDLSSQRSGQVLSVPEVLVQPSAPVASGTSDEAKKME
ncbi:innexin unc-9-like [Mercenaria mercenaria]|uniref:innexin unc-9-like n=1 Tax=Mercenaria mercenaria TaxID=6596 RepID=UPI00234F6B5D|nr:innexin unc-9-like [Mercenaria mercenaria]